MSSPETPTPQPQGFFMRVAVLFRRRPVQSIGVMAGVVMLIVVGSVVASSLVHPSTTASADSPTGSEHHLSTNDSHPRSQPSTAKPTGFASIPVSTDNGLIADNDQYSTGPKSAVVVTGADSANTSARASELAFTVMLVRPNVPIATTSDSWTSPSGTVFGDSEFSAQLATDSPAGFAAMAAVTVPASGLQAATTTYSLATWTAKSTTPVATVTVAPSCTQACDLGVVWYSGDTTVIQWNEAGYTTPLSIQAVNTTTGATIWKGTQPVVDAVGSMLIIQNADWSFQGLRISTGAVAWTFAPKGSDRSDYLGFLGGDYISGDWEYQDQNDNTVTQEFVLQASTGRLVIQREGDPPGSCLCDNFSGISYDATSGNVIVEADPTGDDQDGFGIEVVKASDGSTVYSLPPSGLAALGNPPLLGATNGSAWISKGSTNDLFLEATGKEDPNVSDISSIAFSPDYTVGSISVLERPIAGVSLIVAVQNEPLTVPLFAQIATEATTQ